MKNKMKGFSLGEILVVITIIALMAIAALLTYQHQVNKANDATRKDHLNKFKLMFEDYYSDKNCYPTQAQWDACTCGGNCMTPYMETFYCDPVGNQKYYYLPFTNDSGQVDTCMGYRLYAKLQNTSDADIARVGCGPRLGCGVGILANYNYGISMGGPLVAADFVPDLPDSGPTGTPTPIVGPNFCLGDGSKLCNTKTGCALEYDKRACDEVLRTDYGCRGFADPNECSAKCRSDYDATKCMGTESVQCTPWRRCN